MAEELKDLEVKEEEYGKELKEIMMKYQISFMIQYLLEKMIQKT